jgi:cholesterol transport system auxiliary component
MSNRSFPRSRFYGSALLLLLVAGCSALSSTAIPPPSLFALDRTETPTAKSRLWQDGAAVAKGKNAPTLIVNPPYAAAGFDSQRIVYVRKAHQLEYFSHSEWVDTPARMIAPLIVAATEEGAAFRAVVLTPSAAAGDLRLDTEIIRLQHEFGGTPGRVRFTLRASLVDNTTRRVLAQREFDETISTASDDPRSGVVAANQAVQVVLEKLAGFCTEAARAFSSGNPGTR